MNLRNREFEKGKITMKNDLKILAVALEKKLGKAHAQHDEYNKGAAQGVGYSEGQREAFRADAQPPGIACRLSELG